MERGHAAVVQIRIVRPDAGQRRGGVALAPDELAFGRERALVERGDEPGRHDVDASAIRADVLVDAGPLDVAAAIVDAMAARAADLLRIEQRLPARRQRRVDLVRVGRRPEMTNHRRELFLDLRDDRRDQRVERPVLLELHRRGHERKAPVEAAIGVPAASRHLRRRVPERRCLGVAPADVLDRRHGPVRPQVQLDVRGRKRGRPRARERVDLVVMMALQDPVGVGGQRAIRWVDREHGPPALARQRLERLAQPEVIEGLGASPQVGDPVDLRGVADEAVHGPPQRQVRPWARRHAVRRHVRLLTP